MRPLKALFLAASLYALAHPHDLAIEETPPIDRNEIASLPPPSSQFTIILDETLFPETDGVREDFQKVANDVVEVISRRFTAMGSLKTQEVELGFNPGCSSNTPCTSPVLDNRVVPVSLFPLQRIIDTRDYGRFAYQLAHELGHIIMGIYRTNDVIEVLADALSYQVLTDLTVLWQEKYAGSHEEKWAPSFVIYRESLYRDNELKLGLPDKTKSVIAAVHKQDWIAAKSYLYKHQAILEKAPYAPKAIALRSLAARAFLSGPVDWSSLQGITNFTTPSPEDDKTFYNIPLDMARMPANVQTAIARFHNIYGRKPAHAPHRHPSRPDHRRSRGSLWRGL